MEIKPIPVNFTIEVEEEYEDYHSYHLVRLMMNGHEIFVDRAHLTYDNTERDAVWNVAYKLGKLLSDD